MAKTKLKMNLPSVDDLFSTEEERQEAKLPKIYDVPLTQIDDFPEHPYRVLDDEDMEALMESIKERGVITPALVRKKDDRRYEMISGHRRKRACERLGLLSMRCELKDISRDEAIILMVDSNSQRSEIAPCDKGRAYQMKLEAIKRQGERTDLTSTPVGEKLKGKEATSVSKLENDSGDSATQIQRYIRLTNLVPELQDFVDEGKIKMRPAVELSYLDEESQRDVVDLIDETEAFPSHDQAIRMRKAFEDGKLDHSGVDKIMKEEKPNQRPTYKLKYEDIKAYFKPGASDDVVLRDILKGLELLKKQRARENREAR
jgi:ParB family chromosome partitioning protein